MKRLLVCSIPLLLVGCVQSEESVELHAVAKEVAAHGVTFTSADLLGGYERAASGEGLGGIAWLDYDNDGDLDLYLTNGVGASNGMFRNNGDGGFTNVTAAAGLSAGIGNSGVVVGDLDNDGNVDIFLTGEGHLVGPGQTPVRLYRNNGDGTFTDHSFNPAMGIVANDSALGAALGDVDGDGYLDIFIASPGHIPFLTGPGTGESHPNKLYINNGDFTFTDVAASAGVTGLYEVPGVGTLSDGACVASFIDYDMDNDLDILVGNCNAYPYFPFPMPVRPTPFNLYSNNGDGTFTDVAAAAGLNINGFWMGLALGDIDNDGDVDFFATSTGSFANGAFPHVMMRNNGDGTFTNVAGAMGGTEFGWGTTMADFDNDGDLDLYQVGSLPLFGAIGPGAGSPGRLYFNDGNGNFTDTSAATGVNLSFAYTSGVAQGDYDGDGFADLVVMTAPWSVSPTVGNPSGAPVVLRNEGNGNHAVTLRLVPAGNRSPVGARVEVKANGEYQYRTVRAGTSMASSESPWPSVGIGAMTSAKVTVTWPSGCIEKFNPVAAGQLATLVEGNGDTNSCN